MSLMVLALVACNATTGAHAAASEGNWREVDCEWDGGWFVPAVTEPVPLVAWVSDGEQWRVPDLVEIDEALQMRYSPSDGYTVDCVVFVAR